MEDTSPAGTVVHLLVAPAAGEPIVELDAARLVAGRGIEGDRYVLGTGHWSDPRWPDQQLTLVEAELVCELGLDPRHLRRNIVTTGVGLATLVGRDFRLGTAVLRGVRPCDPCRYLETLTRPGLYHDLAGRGGLRAAVLESGVVRAGDPLILIPPAPSG
ncbi:MAG: MOSC domain-containing protein [Dehalococcoidia bacterium]|nr:MOSC domain-containing protein [Dehalococcoidia bacterium]